MNYSFDETVLVWLDDKSLISTVKKIATSLKLKAFVAKHETDIYAAPCFLAIIDGSKVSKSMLDNLKELNRDQNPKEFAILFIPMPDFKIPVALKKYVSKPHTPITDEWLKILILNKRNALVRHKSNKRSYDKTIFRLMYMVRKLMVKNSVLFIDDLCREFNVSEKTIKRDIVLLRSIGEDIEYDKEKKGYTLNFSLNQILINND